jgi:hypothetical protein
MKSPSADAWCGPCPGYFTAGHAALDAALRRRPLGAGPVKQYQTYLLLGLEIRSVERFLQAQDARATYFDCDSLQLDGRSSRRRTRTWWEGDFPRCGSPASP